MEIRPATDSDWAAIYPFFRAIVDAGETYAYPPDLTEADGRAIWMQRPPSLTIVAVDDDGRILGSAKTGPNRDGRGAHIATASFMVDPSGQARGVGRALATYVLDWARNQGFHGMQFNAVVETNTRAVALWQQLGFEIIGTVPEAFDSQAHGLVGLHVMYRKLSAD
jgi:L-amino acid N-acyltransferase YncA